MRKFRPLWSFSFFTEEYELHKETITVRRGLLNHYYDTEATTSIVDIDESMSIWQRMLGLVTIILSFEGHKKIYIKNVPLAELHGFIEYCKMVIAKRRRVDAM